ncbi:MAG: hypothetical protein O3A53_09070 [Acidobacteria bacterium]|nr:hypothetical protein [Acidobacteriota bacterium]MDA1234939.1 hypothetical protein [Acidobacteriota bacterium]
MANDLQRIDWKVLVDTPEKYSADPILTVFERWRQEKDAPSDWVDLADYAHMQRGPRVMMAGKREHFSLDTNVPGVGLLLQTRKGLEGSVEERFVEAMKRHLALAVRLTGEEEWPLDLQPQGDKWIVAINDRLGFPNDAATEAALKSGLTAALDRIFGAGGYTMTRDEDPLRRYGYSVEAKTARTLAEILGGIS